MQNINNSLKKSPRVVSPRDIKYLKLAFSIADIFSKDPDTQVGAIIVGEDNKVYGIGYNGPPRYVNDNNIDWTRENKRSVVIHAEINAIQNSSRDVRNTTLYVTAPPCKPCILNIINSGIKRVVYCYIPDESSSINENGLRECAVFLIEAQIELCRIDYKEIGSGPVW